MFGTPALVASLTIVHAARSMSPEDRLAHRLKNGPGVSNHPVGVIPSSSIRIPPGWPLATDGSITCKTCHRALPSFEGRGDPDLRTLSEGDLGDKSFCLNCHQESSNRSAAGMHWMAMTRAHIMANERNDAVSSAKPHEGSGACLSCHDGVTAPDVAYQTAGGRRSSGGWDSAMNHPVGIPYPRAGKRGMEMPLRPAAQLPDSVRLPGGMVSCVSCHDLYSSRSARLSVPVEGSRLCLTCHQAD